MSTADSPSAAARSSLVARLMLLVLVAVHGAAWVVPLWFLYFSVPRYERLFADFRMRLPDSTTTVIDASRWLSQYPFVLPFALFGFVVVDGAVLFFLLGRGGQARVLLGFLWFLLLLLLPVAVWACCWFAVQEPYDRLLDGLGGHQ